MRKATVLVSALFGLCLVRGLAGCGGELQCRTEAVRFLPDDPRQISEADLADLVGRLHACKQAGTDAGPR